MRARALACVKLYAAAASTVLCTWVCHMVTQRLAVDYLIWVIRYRSHTKSVARWRVVQYLGEGSYNDVYSLMGADHRLHHLAVRIPKRHAMGCSTLWTQLSGENTLWTQLSGENTGQLASLWLGQEGRGGVPVVGVLPVRWLGHCAKGFGSWHVLREGADDPQLDLRKAMESADLVLLPVYRRGVGLDKMAGALAGTVRRAVLEAHSCSG